MFIFWYLTVKNGEEIALLRYSIFELQLTPFGRNRMLKSTKNNSQNLSFYTKTYNYLFLHDALYFGIFRNVFCQIPSVKLNLETHIGRAQQNFIGRTL